MCEVSKRRQLLECLGFGVVLKGFEKLDRVPPLLWIDNLSFLRWMRLRRLDVMSLSLNHATHEDIIAIADCCPSLTNLIVSTNLSDNFNYGGFEKKKKKYKWKDVSFLEDRAITTIVLNCQKLKEVEITGCNELSRDSFIALGQLAITSLTVCKCKNLFKNVELAELSGCYKSLKSLYISSCDNLTDALMAGMAKCCCDLLSLTIVCCDYITDAALIAVAENCSKLEMLETVQYYFSDVAIFRIAKCCPQLRKLSFLSCRVNHVTEKALIEVAVNCRKIENIMCNIDLTDAAAERFVEFSSKLRHITMRRNKCSQQTLIRLIQGCPNLHIAFTA